MVKLYDLISEIFKEEVSEYLNNLNLKYFSNIDKRVKTRTQTFVRNSIFIENKNLVISSINKNPELECYPELSNIDISDKSYFIYNYCGHSDDWILHEFKDLKEAEQYLLEESDNMFTTYLFVFKNLRRLKYEIKDNKIVWGNN